MGFFGYGEDVICYGHGPSGRVSKSSSALLFNANDDVRIEAERPCFPFDPDEIVENLLRERAFTFDGNPSLNSLIRSSYYRLRPLLPKGIRKHLQASYMAAKSETNFPKWPLDCSVEKILERLLGVQMRAQGIQTMPFIWFWPDGCSCALTLTHDVETIGGRDFCNALMDLDESAGFRSSFQLVPEERYPIPAELLTLMRDRGFEINVHDLNHDGRLYSKRELFFQRAQSINHYGKLMMAKGFRAWAMYRDLRWYEALDFEYDMSVPNVGRWEAQNGGCCTVMPYFVGSILEVPLTTLQDYVLFELWGDYSIDIWKEQARLIRDKHGLIHFLIHPDYVKNPPALDAYKKLLEFLRSFRLQENVWCALPGEVNEWWRLRARMSLVEDGLGNWYIDGPGSERAQLAFADLSGDTVVYRIPKGSGLANAREMCS